MSSLVQIKNNSPTSNNAYLTNPINSMRASIIKQPRHDLYLNNILTKIPHLSQLESSNLNKQFFNSF